MSALRCIYYAPERVYCIISSGVGVLCIHPNVEACKSLRSRVTLYRCPRFFMSLHEHIKGSRIRGDSIGHEKSNTY